RAGAETGADGVRAVAPAIELGVRRMIRAPDLDLLERHAWIADPQARPPLVRAGLVLVSDGAVVGARHDLPRHRARVFSEVERRVGVRAQVDVVRLRDARGDDA